MTAVGVTWVTDPADPVAWGAGPAMAAVRGRFASEEVDVDYVLAGVHGTIDDPVGTAHVALDVQEATGMPVDVRPWLGPEPPRSSAPGSRLVCAARAQGHEGTLLRVLLLAFQVGAGPAPDTAEGLLVAASTVPGLDVARLGRTSGHAAAEADRARAAALGARAGKLPLLLVAGERVRPDELVDAVHAAGARERPTPSVAQVLADAPPGGLAAAEVAAACALLPTDAEAALWALAAGGEVRPRRIAGGGALWEPAA